MVHLADTWRLMAPVDWNAGLSNAVLGRGATRSGLVPRPGNDNIWDSAIYTSNQVLEGLYGVGLLADPAGTDRARLLASGPRSS